MTMHPRWLKFFMIGAAMTAAISCNRPTHAADDLPKPAVDLPLGKEGEKRDAVLAGGCFWCIETSFEQIPGVIDVVSGYAGGTKDDAKYEVVGTGQTNHAEAVRITYDASKVTYGELLRVLFTIIDPTTVNGQHPDYGRQYRSAIFFANDDEKRVADGYIKQLTEAKQFDKPIATTVEPLGDGFFVAEDYHQNYVQHNPSNPYVRAFSLPKAVKAREKFGQSTTQPTK
jgi:peptide-methionine (S)-S-oxide reductase